MQLSIWDYTSTTSSFDSTTDRNINMIKFVFIGDRAVGKTSILVTYTTNGYPSEYVPTAFDNYSVIVTVDNHLTRLQLCDTAGQDDFDSLRPLCYPRADVFLLCFSVVCPTSFYNITKKWIPEVRKHCPTAPVLLVGTQCDLRTDVKVLIALDYYHERPINEYEARELAQRVSAVGYIECSALTEKNLKEVFDTAVWTTLENNRCSGVLTPDCWNRISLLSFSDSTSVPVPCSARLTLGDKFKKWWGKFCCFS
ncbi:cell division control protein 42 homolog [Limulus polyphemus]|uniref:Cell division control protein 42 homolog n=1 Tax=Limulus polyphemus TaxID=6850 RepID=A0ABM1SLV7_LIMPO|nr:cell division control protein 42 homolog [Limulus polyphemus]